MKRDIILSLILHLTVILAMVVSAPFSIKPQNNFDDVIRVSLTSMPDLPSQVQEIPTQPVSVPAPAVEDNFEIPIDDPSTVDTKAEIDEPEPVKEPEPEPEEKPKSRQPQPNAEPAESGDANGEKTEVDAPTSGAGSVFSGMTIDNATFNYPYWFNQTFNKLGGNFHNRVAFDGELICVISFQVIRSGKIIDLKVEESSGIEAFDQGCLDAVTKSEPLPPLPRQFKDEIIKITLPFQFSR